MNIITGETEAWQTHTHTHTQTTGLLRNTLTTGMLIRPQQSAGATSGRVHMCGRVHRGYEYH